MVGCVLSHVFVLLWLFVDDCTCISAPSSLATVGPPDVDIAAMLLGQARKFRKELGAQEVRFDPLLGL